MGDFIFADTNFGIDEAKSRCALTPGPDSQLLLTVDVHGSQEIHDRLVGQEGLPWRWYTYPPHFYVHGYPVPAAAKDGVITVRLKPRDLDDYDIALYMMEHNDVNKVVIQITKDLQLDVSGRLARGALIKGQPAFRISWAKAQGGA